MEEWEQAIKLLKEYLSSSSLLSKPTLIEDFFLYLAMSDTIVSLVLIKEVEGHQSLVYYPSKAIINV